MSAVRLYLLLPAAAMGGIVAFIGGVVLVTAAILFTLQFIWGGFLK